MKVFKTRRVDRLASGAKAFLLNAVIIFIILLAFYYFGPISQSGIKLGAIICFMIWIRESIVPYRVREIHFNDTGTKMRFELVSRLSGTEQRVYELKDVSAKIIKRKWYWMDLFPTILRIDLPNKGVFQITGRYGFSADTLRKICDAITLFQNNLQQSSSRNSS